MFKVVKSVKEEAFEFFYGSKKLGTSFYTKLKLKYKGAGTAGEVQLGLNFSKTLKSVNLSWHGRDVGSVRTKSISTTIQGLNLTRISFDDIIDEILKYFNDGNYLEPVTVRDYSLIILDRGQYEIKRPIALLIDDENRAQII